MDTFVLWLRFTFVQVDRGGTLMQSKPYRNKGLTRTEYNLRLGDLKMSTVVKYVAQRKLL